MSEEKEILKITAEIFGDASRVVSPAEIASVGFGSISTQFRRRRKDSNYPKPIVNKIRDTRWLASDIVRYYLQKSQANKAA